MKQRVIVGAYIFNNEGKFLICRQSSGNGVFPGMWGLPGGGIEDGETMMDALRREMNEEVGIEIDAIKPLYFSDGLEKKYKHGKEIGMVYMIYLRFVCMYKSGVVRLNDEHDDYVWVSAKEALHLELNPPTRESIVYLDKNE